MCDRLFAIRLVLHQCSINRSEQRLLVNWLGEKIDRSTFIALTVGGISPRPVRKITGIEVFAEINFWTSQDRSIPAS
jgi:hypothetical protein